MPPSNPSGTPAVGSRPSNGAVRLSPVLQYDDADTPCDIIDALVLDDFVSGRHPWSRTVRLSPNRPEPPSVPPDARLVRTAVEYWRRSQLFAGDGWSARVVIWKGQGGNVTVTAVDAEIGQAALSRIMASARVTGDVDTVGIGFWHHNTRRGAQRDLRMISAPDWSTIRPNYSTPAATALDDLMAVTPESISGRLILLHGAPGTGKTTALRALARRWRSWCQVDCVLDPDQLFADTAYLSEVAVAEDDDGDENGNDDGATDPVDGDGGGPPGRDAADTGPTGDDRDPADPVDEGADPTTDPDRSGSGRRTRRWRLLILEDCDELIRGEARQAAGQSLSRLLNLTDGLLGQGRDVLVAITTNEDLTRLHPAVVRPGRCLARIEVGPLSYAEATAWLDNAADAVPDRRITVPPGGATLAELYALKAGLPADPVLPEIGGYL